MKEPCGDSAGNTVTAKNIRFVGCLLSALVFWVCMTAAGTCRLDEPSLLSL